MDDNNQQQPPAIEGVPHLNPDEFDEDAWLIAMADNYFEELEEDNILNEIADEYEEDEFLNDVADDLIDDEILNDAADDYLDDLQLNDAAEAELLLIPDQQAPPSPQLPGEKPHSNFDYVDYEHDRQIGMYNAETNTHQNEADMPFDFTRPWDQINRITQFVNRVETDTAMAGAVQDILIIFKNNCNPRPDNDADWAQLLQNIDNIVWLTGYIAAHYIAIRKDYLRRNNQDFNRYYKVRITTKAYHVKPDDLNHGWELCLVFNNERIINRFDPRGVPWGFTTPWQAYKMAAGAC